jgi:hypothetical protein
VIVLLVVELQVCLVVEEGSAEEIQYQKALSTHPNYFVELDGMGMFT